MNLKYLVAVGFASLLAYPGISLSQQVSLSCSDIADPAERLACFDRTFPGETNGTVSSPPPGSVQSTSVTREAPVAVDSTSSASNTVVPRSAQFGRGLFSAREELNISSRLKAVRDKEKQKMVFRLENDQVWLQDSPRSLPFREGDEVTIKSGTIGGYILSNSKGLSTRVRQIK